MLFMTPKSSILIVFAIFLLTTSAYANPPTVSIQAHKALGEVQGFLNEAQWNKAENILETFIQKFSGEPTALFHAWQMRGYLFSETGRYKEALNAFENAIKLCPNDKTISQQALYNIAQLLTILNKNDEAVKHIELWIGQADTLSAQQKARIAWIYFNAKRYDMAISYLEKAIHNATKPEENWFEMLLASLHHSANYKGLLHWLPQLIERNPMEKRYWQQMAAAYMHLENERQAAAVLSAAYYKGLIDNPSEIKSLSQIFCMAGVPQKGAGLLQHALDNNHLAADSETYELLANTWLQAREIRRAVSVLKKKAQQCGDCNTRIRLGQLLIQLENWNEAIEYLKNAIHKQCKNQNEEATFLLGLAAYHEGRFQEAHDAFHQALKCPKLSTQAETWLKLLNKNAISAKTQQMESD